METKQLYEKVGSEFVPINPSVSLDELYDKSSDLSLGEILAKYNHITVDWKGDVETTRNEIPLNYRHNGLYITYDNGDKVITEYYIGKNANINSKTWIDNSNWKTPITEDWINHNFKHLKVAKESVGYDNLDIQLRQLVNQNTNVTNYPDNEDLTSKDNLLKIKDREYEPEEFSGKGYVILRKNIQIIEGVRKNILEESMIGEPNTVYEVRYDFDLNDDIITLPKGSIIKYNGGTISNGTLIVSRPTNVNVGFQYFDTDINKPIWWTGDKWVDANGNNI